MTLKGILKRGHILALMLGSGIFPACGEKGNDTSADAPFQEPIFEDNRPELAKVGDADCMEQGTPIALTETSIYHWQEFNINDAMEPVEDVRSAPSLQSAIIRETTYGREFYRDCDGTQTQDGNCIDPATGKPANLMLRKSVGGFLRACRDHFSYDRNTFEAVGLTSLQYINHAYAAYQKIPGGEKLEPIRLEILPLWETRLHSGTGNERTTHIKYMTDNAAYMTSSHTDQNAIVVWPHGEQKSGAGHLWESAFVLQHEFGHHIEHAYWQGFWQQLGYTWDGAAHRYLAVSADATTNQGRGNVAGSISEAFADLASYYSLSGDVTSLVGIPCLGVNRNPKRELFANASPKQLTYMVAAQLMLGQVPHLMLGQVNALGRAAGYDCETPNFSDVHIVGAIWVYVIDQAFQATSQWLHPEHVNDAADYGTRYGLLLKWLPALKARFANENNINTLEKIFTEVGWSIADVLNTALHADKAPDGVAALQSKLCHLFAEKLPVMSSTPFADADGKCTP